MSTTETETIVYNMFLYVTRIRENRPVWAGGYTDIDLASKAIYTFAKNFGASGHHLNGYMFFHQDAGEGEQKVTVDHCLDILYDIKNESIAGPHQLHLNFHSINDNALITVRKEMRREVYCNEPGKNNRKIMYSGVNEPITLNEYPGEKF